MRLWDEEPPPPPPPPPLKVTMKSPPPVADPSVKGRLAALAQKAATTNGDNATKKRMVSAASREEADRITIEDDDTPVKRREKAGPDQGLTLVHFSAQLEPCRTQENTLHTLSTPLTRATQPLRAPPIPYKR